ncbi:hypothetical protein AGMMS49965_14260 [Bacteroidia bacterium]|nr:hypothetical protein AGMMS49965_14260 [Bacteroidia bacterium]
MKKAVNLSQIGLYNPRRQSSELSERLFVIRQKQFEMLMAAISDEDKNSIPQHHIIIAQRGMGKTTMLHRIAIELHKSAYKDRFIPLAFPEEQYTVTNLGNFWLNCLDALADSLELEHYDANEVKNIDNRVKELSLYKNSDETASQAYRFLMEFCKKIKRRPVLLVDNIGLIFNRLSKNSQHSLRAVLSENGAPIVLGAGVVILPSQTNNKADVVKSITTYEMPFYDYFQIHYLKKLTFDEFLDLIKNLASVTNSDISTINKELPRLQTLHQLTGGNPRTAVMLFKLIVNGFSTEINDDLEALLDEITPLYKARYEEISEQSQKIIATIALNWDAISLKNLSQQSGYANNQLSPQLKRLIEEGWVETTPAYKAKGNAYFISERFFNIWFIMRMSTRRQKQEIYCLSQFLECFYGKELKRKKTNYLNKAILELYKRNEGNAKKQLIKLLTPNSEITKNNQAEWYHFASICLNLNYGEWLLKILEEKGYDSAWSPYNTAIKALEIEKQDSKNGQKIAEIYLKNRAVEISEPARVIIEKMKQYMLHNSKDPNRHTASDTPAALFPSLA